MSDFCDFVPDDPTCQTEVTIDDTVGGGDATIDDAGVDPSMKGEEHDEHYDMEHMGKMEGEWTWEKVDAQLDEWLPGQPMGAFRSALMTTVSIATGAYLQQFRYKNRTPDFFTTSA